MKRLEDEQLLLITSVIYSERCELKGERKQQVLTSLYYVILLHIMSSFETLHFLANPGRFVSWVPVFDYIFPLEHKFITLYILTRALNDCFPVTSKSAHMGLRVQGMLMSLHCNNRRSMQNYHLTDLLIGYSLTDSVQNPGIYVINSLTAVVVLRLSN